MTGAYSFLPFAAARARATRSTATGPCGLGADRARSAALRSSTATSTAPAAAAARGAALRPRRHRRDRRARRHPHRAAQLDHQLRAELSGGDRLLRRGFPVALHAGARRPHQPADVPWIALVVLKAEEFEEGGNIAGRPLLFITLKGNVRQEILPDPASGWSWAHVHVNRGLTAGEAEIVATDPQAVAGRLQVTLGENPDLAYSRLVCPRRLEPNSRLLRVRRSGLRKRTARRPRPRRRPGARSDGVLLGRERGGSRQFPGLFPLAVPDRSRRRFRVSRPAAPAQAGRPARRHPRPRCAKAGHDRRDLGSRIATESCRWAGPCGCRGWPSPTRTGRRPSGARTGTSPIPIRSSAI